MSVSTTLLLVATLATPPSEPAPASKVVSRQNVASTEPNKTTKDVAPLTLEEVRKTYLAGLRASARRKMPEPAQVVPMLAGTYRDLEQVAGLSHAERSRMRGVVKARLEELRDKLIRDVLRQKQRADRVRARQGNPRIAPTRPADEKAALLAGGGASAQAVKLIDLIQNTIEPDSWQVNGGRGTISYFGLLNALVIRQTGEVHHQLGGTLEQLRR